MRPIKRYWSIAKVVALAALSFLMDVFIVYGIIAVVALSVAIAAPIILAFGVAVLAKIRIKHIKRIY